MSDPIILGQEPYQIRVNAFKAQTIQFANEAQMLQQFQLYFKNLHAKSRTKKENFQFQIEYVKIPASLQTKAIAILLSQLKMFSKVTQVQAPHTFFSQENEAQIARLLKRNKSFEQRKNSWTRGVIFSNLLFGLFISLPAVAVPLGLSVAFSLLPLVVVIPVFIVNKELFKAAALLYFYTTIFQLAQKFSQATPTLTFAFMMPYNIAMTFLTAMMGNILASQRQNYLDNAASFYDTPEKIAAIKNTGELTALKAGMAAKTWSGYAGSFILYSAYRHPVAFAAGLEQAIEENELVVKKLQGL